MNQPKEALFGAPCLRAEIALTAWNEGPKKGEA